MVMQSPPSKSKSNSTIPAVVASTTVNLQEKLRRKRQALLNKQFKADKLAEQLKTEREKQEQQNREDELREMAIKLRRRQREIRHAYDSHSSDSSCDSDDANSTSSISRILQSRSSSPKEVNEERISKYRDKEKIKEKKEKDYQSATKSGSPKPYIECEKRMYYEDKDRDAKRKSDYKKDRDSRNDHYKDKTSRSLVDY